MITEELIRFDHVSKHYGRGIQRVDALQGIDLAIHHGEFVTLVGPSGSGKSTLLNIMGLIDSADSGTIRWEGVDVSGYSDAHLSRIRRQHIGLIFQSFNLIPILTAAENVGYPLLRSGLRASEQRVRIKEALNEVSLAELAHRMPNQLSGGQQQRVAIGRALVKKPSLILADEPTANLDSANGHVIVELLKELNHRDGVTIVLATHDERFMGIADRSLALLDGALHLGVPA